MGVFFYITFAESQQPGEEQQQRLDLVVNMEKGGNDADLLPTFYPPFGIVCLGLFYHILQPLLGLVSNLTQLLKRPPTSFLHVKQVLWRNWLARPTVTYPSCLLEEH